MLTTRELQEHLERLTYKPGWKFTIYDGDWEGQHIVITTVVENAYQRGEHQVLDVHSQLPPMPSLGYFERWLGWRLAIIEVHEMREFLQRDGKPIFDPHAPNANRDNPTYVPDVPDLPDL